MYALGAGLDGEGAAAGLHSNGVEAPASGDQIGMVRHSGEQAPGGGGALWRQSLGGRQAGQGQGVLPQAVKGGGAGAPKTAAARIA